MATRSRLFRVDPLSKVAEELQPGTFSANGFLETKDIHEWLAGQAGMLGEDILVIQREHVGVEGSGRRPDILAIDSAGNLVVVEAKRDDSGTEVHWQAIRYAASYWPRSGKDLIEMYASYAEIEKEDALQKLLKHTGSVDEEDLLAKLNRKQRIVLVSGGFHKEVTTAVLWLREQHGVDISCLQLTLHNDLKTSTHYVQATYIIPVPDTKDITVELRKTQQEHAAQDSVLSDRKTDEVTVFFLNVRELLEKLLASDMMPSKFSRWAGTSGTLRYFRLWYDEWPWANFSLSFVADLETAEDSANKGTVYVHLSVYRTALRDQVSPDDIEELKTLCRQLRGTDGLKYDETAATFNLGKRLATDGLSDEGAQHVAEALANLVSKIGPAIRVAFHAKNLLKTG